MHLSKFGNKFLEVSSIQRLMEDLKDGLNDSQSTIMLGGGAPGKVPQLKDILWKSLRELTRSAVGVDRLIGEYSHPSGDRDFAASLARLFKREYGWKLKAENIVLTNGSQNSFFYLFNILAGTGSDGTFRRIILPLLPEYIGYADTGIEEDCFLGFAPQIEETGKHEFKYRIDFRALDLNNAGAVCLSRPTNPSGNVISDEELYRLYELTRKINIPLIVDAAYGGPFPGIVFNDATPFWDEGVVLTLSLSKFGLPGVRTGIVIASEELARILGSINAVFNLSGGNLGPALIADLVASGEILSISRDTIRPFYQERSRLALQYFHEAMGDDLPYAIHRSEGAFFLWARFRNMPISSRELYLRLKDRGVIVVPGEYFFPGLKQELQQARECIRISFARDDVDMRKGLQIIAQEVRRAYDDASPREPAVFPIS